MKPFRTIVLQSLAFLLLLTSARGAPPVYEEVFATIGLSNTGALPHDRLVQTADGNFYGTADAGGVKLGGTVYRITPAGALRVVYAFEAGHTDVGYRPQIGLTRGADGNLYGLTTQSSANGLGSLFKITPEGALSRVRYLSNPGPFGVREYRAALIQGSDGAFYGTTFRDSANASSTGSVFQLPLTGATGFNTVLTTATGFNSEASLVEAEGGNFYGTASKGGANGMGTIFQVTPAGVVTALFSFSGPDGDTPRSALVKASDGNYYGTTSLGGANNFGTVFRFNPATGVTTLHSFDGANGRSPTGGLTVGPDGHLYGTTTTGGAENVGAFYRIDLQGQFTFLASFNEPIGTFPQNGVVLGQDGNFYGTALFGGEYDGGTIFRASASGTLTHLASLGDPEGYGPTDGVIEASDGNFYGPAAVGGNDNSGTIFRITPGGAVSTMAHFEEATTGRVPTRVVQGPDGNLYGATLITSFNYQGSVFKLTLQGELTVIAPLTQELGLGATDFLMGSDGNFYGLTFQGGSNNAGAIFRLTPNGDLSPFSSLTVGPLLGGSFRFTRDTDGAFYGTASHTGNHGGGVAFKVSPAGIDSVFPFSSFDQGSGPYGGVTKGMDGNFYGTTSTGGAFGRGTVFRMTPGGALSRIASFNHPDVGLPVSGLALADDGSFYGTTHGAGSVASGGAVFNVTTDGAITISAVFGREGGDRAQGAIIRASDGYFYGTTTEGGIGGGVVLRFTSSPPELNGFQPSGGAPGDPVILSGKFLAGTSSVKFNGTPASFTIDDSMHITAIVPAGATSGVIEIANPLGSASTASSFAVGNNPQVLNVSTRLPVGTDDNVLIEGFIVEGPVGSTKKIIVRAIGPWLANFGVTDALANPTLAIHDSSNAVVASNNDWKNTQIGGLITGDQSAEITASGLAPNNDLESAIIANLAPGSYTAVVRGVGNTVGTGVVDGYDLSASSAARLANFATRGLIQPGDKLMIAGFITQNGLLRAVVRAAGPSLVAFGINNALPDTTLQLRDQNGAIVRENDDWKTDQQQELEATGLQPTHELEAALVHTLPPGQYTAQVRGKPESTGIGVVEVYFLQ